MEDRLAKAIEIKTTLKNFDIKDDYELYPELEKFSLILNNWVITDEWHKGYLNIKNLGTLIRRNNKKGIELNKKVVTLRKAINEKLGETAKADVKQLLNKFKKKRFLKI